jgi:ketosteroid isomerase-like protein
MGNRGNVEVVQGILAQWAEGNLGAAVDHFDPHVVYVVDPGFPESGVSLGPQGVRDFMLRFLSQWEHYAIESRGVQTAGDTVIAQIVQHGKGRTSGVDIDGEAFFLFTFRGAKIVRMEILLDREEALQAAGLVE